MFRLLRSARFGPAGWGGARHATAAARGPHRVGGIGSFLRSLAPGPRAATALAGVVSLWLAGSGIPAFALPDAAAPAPASAAPAPAPAAPVTAATALAPAAPASTTPVAAPAAQGQAPQRIRVFHLDYDVQDDGTAVQTLHLETAVTNDAAAQQNAQLPMTFSDAVERLELVEAYTQKPDGRRISVDPAAVRVQLAPGVPNLPIYSDRKQMVVVFPGVGGGDVFVSTWRRTTLDPMLPGEFTDTHLFTRNLPWDDVQVTITTPPGRTLQTETHGPELDESRTEDGRHVYRWRYSAPTAARDNGVLSLLDRAPRLFASTLPDWAAFSRAYARLLASKTGVTPPLQALADQVTAGVTDRREQARLLYTWVERHVRWVAIYLGNGPIVPHDAASVMARGYGDCKDQVVLLVALLQAKGIAANPVLINLNPTYRLSGPATLSAFNHVITYLPEWDLYADTTPGGAPFGTLPMAEYGKPTLPVTLRGEPPSRIPPLSAGMATERLRTSAALAADGTVTGTSETEATGPYAVALRMSARSIQAFGSEQAAERQLRSLGEPGEGQYTEIVPDGADMGARVAGRFTLEPHPDWTDGDWFQPPTGLRVLARVGDGLIGPARAIPAAEATPCYAGRQEERLTLSLPPGFRPVQLPRNASVSGSFFRYESKWTFADGVVSVDRTLVSSFDAPVCAGAARAEASHAMPAIRRDIDARISLEKVE